MSDMLPGGGLQQDRFPTVRKGGYDKAHVDDYYVRMDNQFKSLRERLQRMDDELEQYKRDLAIAREKAQVKPEHEQISERMAEILRIAEEEAKERRSKVESEVNEAQKKAKEEIAKHRKDAEQHAERVLSSARSEATELVDSAKKEADQLREQARKEGERRLSEAEARAKKIHETADRRLATLTATHAEALRRLKDMHSTLADLVTAEDKAGPLETGLGREEAVSGEEEKNEQGQATSGQNEKPRTADAAKPEADRAKSEAAPRVSAPSQPEVDEATVRIKPVAKPDRGGQDAPKVDQAPVGEGKKEGVQGTPAQAVSRPPQGGRFSGPAPEGAQGQSVPQTVGGDPGITGVYRRPESGPHQPPKGEESVRVVRKQ